MKIETKYDLGEKVYAIARMFQKEYSKCKLCGGTGEINENGIYITCCYCEGSGKHLEKVTHDWDVKSGLITELIISRLRDNTLKIIYVIDDELKCIDRHIFTSYHEAKQACDKGNNEEKKERKK